MELEEVRMHLEELSCFGLGTNLLNADLVLALTLRACLVFVSARRQFKAAGHYV